MTIQRECFFVYNALVQHVAPLCLQWPLAQLFPAAWAVSMSQSSAYLYVYAKIYFNKTKVLAVGANKAGRQTDKAGQTD